MAKKTAKSAKSAKTGTAKRGTTKTTSDSPREQDERDGPVEGEEPGQPERADVDTTRRLGSERETLVEGDSELTLHKIDDTLAITDRHEIVDIDDAGKVHRHPQDSPRPGKAQSSSTGPAPAREEDDLERQSRGGPIKVEAIAPGYYGHIRRRIGDVFTIAGAQEFSKKWMRTADPDAQENITTTQEALRRETDEIKALRAPAPGMIVGRDVPTPTGKRNPLGDR